MLLDAGHVEVIRDSTHPNHQLVIRHLVLHTGVQHTHTSHHLPVHVQPHGMREVEVMLVPEARVPDGLYDATELQGAHRGAGQQRGEEEVVPGADDDDIEQLSEALTTLEVPQDTVAAPARAQDDQVLSPGALKLALA